MEGKIVPNPATGDLKRQALAPYQDELSTVETELTTLDRGTRLETMMDNFLLQALLESTGTIANSTLRGA